MKFLEAAHVKDLVGLLRLLDNPWDELAWFRTLRLLEGVGAATARRVMADLGIDPVGGAKAVVDPLVTPLSRFLAAAPKVPAPARDQLSALRSTLAECVDACLPGGATPPPAVQVERLGRWLGPVIERVYDAAPARLADLARLEGVAGLTPTRGRFVADLTLDPPASTSDLAGPPLLDEDWLVLSTVHSAKGGEWDVVHVLHASDGMFPSDMATGDPDGIEEERRLLYVAVTRARLVLEVNVPLRYHHSRHHLGDGHSFAQVSRFLSPRVQDLMDRAHVESRPGAGDHDDLGHGGTACGGGLAGVDHLLADLWA